MASSWGLSWGDAWNGYWGDTGGAPPPPAEEPAPPPLHYPGSGWKRLEEARRRRPKPKELQRIIAEVAESQVQRLETDPQKQFDELARELEARNIQWEKRYLELLAEKRELLINEEIRLLLHRKLKRQREEEVITMLLMRMI
jgi:hypothetical protein